MNNSINNIDAPMYASQPVAATEDATIAHALTILNSRLTRASDIMANAVEVKQYLHLRLQQKEREVFAVMFLNSQHRLIEYDEMFQGTINAAAVYPREVAKKALQVNAAAVILAHNHPSSVATPSSADIDITNHIKKSLKLFDVVVLDHIIIAGAESVSFAEMGMV